MNLIRLFPLLALSFLAPVIRAESAALQATGTVGGKSLVLSYNTPGDARTALPLGNGDIGVQSWVEPNGDLVMLIGKTDAWGEQSQLLKLGKIRIKLDVPLSANKTALRQTLDMASGTLQIESALHHDPQAKVSLRLWVDANHPVVHVEVFSANPIGVSANLELWRKERALPAGEAPGVDGLEVNSPVREWPDTIVEAPVGALKDHLVWYHRNERSVYPATLKVQELEGTRGTDPLLNRTFGCALGGIGFEAKSPTSLASIQPATKHSLSLHPLTLQAPTADGWLQALAAQTTEESARDAAACYDAHVQWWHAFWQRSWIDISGGKPEEAKEIANINAGWHANRYLVACGARGAFPVKFNGGIFNVERFDNHSQSKPWMTPDFRNWGSGFWFQNQRHIYWPMLAAGDYDQMPPFFKMYRDALDLAKKRTQIYYKHDGAYFPETMMFWGTWYNNGTFGYGENRKGKEFGLPDCGWIHLYLQGGLELSAMMLEYYRHTGDDAFLKTTLVPIASEVVTYYDKHYKRDAGGKLFISPAQVLETYWDVDNPLPEIAGLRCVVPGLLALPETATTAQQRKDWQRLASELPPLPRKTINGKESLWDAQVIRPNQHNKENGRLYAVWPYRLFGVGMPEFDVAVNSWNTRPYKFVTSSCWHNDIIWGAFLGMPDQARHRLGSRFVMSGSYRFPAMYINGDWVPDHDNGSVCQNTLQSMLMQTVGERILLLPAWPKGWDVSFKLHAPKNTTVECEVRNGKVGKLVITPESRKKNVEVLL